MWGERSFCEKKKSRIFNFLSVAEQTCKKRNQLLKQTESSESKDLGE